MRTYIKVFKFNFELNSMSDSYRYLDDLVENHMKENPGVEIKQMEFLWGNQYGDRDWETCCSAQN